MDESTTFGLTVTDVVGVTVRMARLRKGGINGWSKAAHFRSSLAKVILSGIQADIRLFCSPNRVHVLEFQ